MNFHTRVRDGADCNHANSQFNNDIKNDLDTNQKRRKKDENLLDKHNVHDMAQRRNHYSAVLPLSIQAS